MRSRAARKGVAIVVIALSPLFAIAPLAQAAHKRSATGPPIVSTGNVTDVRGTSAELLGTVNPHGLATTYFFRYGPTAAYGAQTPTVSLGAGTTAVKVGQTVANFPVGYHYRIVATNADGTKEGRDHTHTSKKSKLTFKLAETKELPPTPYGGTFILRGTLSGSGGALAPIYLQSSAYPYLSAFSDLGLAVTTNAAGAFAIPVKGLTESTQLRVRTAAARPLFSPLVTAHVSVRVTLKVRTSSHRGLVRLYGTVTPARVGARVLFQLEKPSRPHGKSEREVRYATEATSVVKRGTRSFSRFSEIVAVRKSGRYRAYVLIRSGALVSGASTSVTLHAASDAKK
jgi:hypothetical protein